MGMEQFVWDRVRELPGRDVVCLGYPDILLIEELPIHEHKDADGIRKWHNWAWKVYDAEAAFKLIGKRAVYLDIAPSRGIEIVVDLNAPLPSSFVECADIVIDCGTLEHCFNVGQAFQNCAALVRQGGSIIHTNPLNAANHGFWAMSPTTYMDFYEGRGFEVEWLEGFHGPKGAREFSPLPVTARFAAPDNSWLVCEARRTGRMDRTWPMQSKYRANPGLKNV